MSTSRILQLQRGFTLIELLVTLAILALLLLMAAPWQATGGMDPAHCKHGGR